MRSPLKSTRCPYIPTCSQYGLEAIEKYGAVKGCLLEAKSRLVGTDKVFLLEGWLPADRCAEIEKTLKPFTCAIETREPTEDEYPQVPVQLKNNKLTRPLNMVTEMYSLPSYGTLDPNPLMAPFFILFYGIMMADMGYGLLMMIASVIISKKYRPKGI